MIFGTILIAIIIFIIVIISIAMFISWLSYKENNLLGGVLLMWVVLALFLLTIFLTRRASQNQQPAPIPAGSSFSGAGN